MKTGLIDQARIEFAALHRICVQLGYHEAIDSHMSMRVPGTEDEIFVSPYPLHWSEVTASSIPRLRLRDGALLEGEYELDLPTWCVHSPLQRNHPWHRCFIHTHMPHTTAITCRKNGRILPIHQHLLSLHNEIAYFDSYHGEVMSEDYGEKIAAAIGKKSIGLLANHGVVTGGISPARAIKRLYYLERAAQFQILAESSGHELKLIDESLLDPPQSQADSTEYGHEEKFFAAWLRILDRTVPDYAR